MGEYYSEYNQEELFHVALATMKSIYSHWKVLQLPSTYIKIMANDISYMNVLPVTPSSS